MGNATAGRVLVAMSGGVDSSVTAYLLKQQGYDCVGATMRLHDAPESAADDAQDAAKVAAQLGMPHYVFDDREEFESQVINRFDASYHAGRTPNPCIECNRFMKFGRLLARADELGCRYIATGHYAQVLPAGEQGEGFASGAGRFTLCRGLDVGKDQSYVLYFLSPAQLERVLLPLGNLSKAQVRRLAAQAGLQTAERPESQDICFVPDGDYVGFLERRAGEPFVPGDIVDCSGHVLGRHAGAIGYTIGQRKGLGVAAGHPVYVCGKDMAANRVIVGERADLACAWLLADDWNWIADLKALAGAEGTFAAEAKLRYRQQARPCTVEPQPDGRVRLSFAEPEYAVAPGQAAVLYRGNQVLGGGTICTVGA